MKSSRSPIEFDLDDSGFFAYYSSPLNRVHPRIQLALRKFLFEAQLETTAVVGCLPTTHAHLAPPSLETF